MRPVGEAFGRFARRIRFRLGSMRSGLWFARAAQDWVLSPSCLGYDQLMILFGLVNRLNRPHRMSRSLRASRGLRDLAALTARRNLWPRATTLEPPPPPPPPPAPPARTPPGYAIRRNVNLVMLHVSVADEHGQFVSRADRGNFRLFEDNVEQKIECGAPGRRAGKHRFADRQQRKHGDKRAKVKRSGP